jgi:hypothetical protein
MPFGGAENFSAGIVPNSAHAKELQTFGAVLPDLMVEANALVSAHFRAADTRPEPRWPFPKVEF